MCCLLGTFSKKNYPKTRKQPQEPLPLFSQVIGFPFRSTRGLNRILMESIKILPLIITTDNPRVLAICWYHSLSDIQKTNWKTNAPNRLDPAWLFCTYTGANSSLSWSCVMIEKWFVIQVWIPIYTSILRNMKIDLI